MRQQCAGKFLLIKSQSFRAPTQQPVRCPCNLFYGSMRRIMRSCSHKAKHPVPPNSDYIPVVLNCCYHNNCPRSHSIQPLRASSTPSLTAQQFHLHHGVLCSVPWKHSSRRLSTIASVLELARAAGRRRASISSISGLVVGSRGLDTTTSRFFWGGFRRLDGTAGFALLVTAYFHSRMMIDDRVCGSSCVRLS